MKKVKDAKPRDSWIPNTWHGYANACGLHKNKKAYSRSRDKRAAEKNY